MFCGRGAQASGAPIYTSCSNLCPAWLHHLLRFLSLLFNGGGCLVPSFYDPTQEVLASFGMYNAYKWVWAGLAFMIGTYLLFGGAVCAAFAVTPVRAGEA